MYRNALIISLAVLSVAFVGVTKACAEDYAPPGTKYFDPNKPITETVAKPSETLFDIAERTRSPIAGLIYENKLKPPYNIQAGQRIKLPPLRVHVVNPDETLTQIAKRYSIDVRSLANFNGIKKPYDVQLGQKIILPAMVSDSLTGLSPMSLVDLLSDEINNGHSVSGTNRGTIRPMQPANPVKPALANSAKPINRPPTNSAKSAQPNINRTPVIATKKYQPSEASSVGTAVGTVAGSSAIGASKAIIHNKAPIKPKTYVADTVPNNTVKKKLDDNYEKPKNNVNNEALLKTLPNNAKVPKEVLEVGNIKWSWPLNGNIIDRFGAKKDYRVNDGINIGAPENTPYLAAADGVVAYVGNQIPGYGWLVMVKHSNKYITSYAYSSVVKVKEGQSVKRGQILGYVGKTGRVSQPCLNFQIRLSAKPVNPANYLPENSG